MRILQGRQVTRLRRQTKGNFMKDIKIKDNAIAFENGDWVLVSGVDRVIQHIGTALKTLKGDWLLNYRKGINYPDNLKEMNDAVLKAEIKTAVREVDGVENIKKFNYKRKQQKINAYIKAQIDGEEQDISEELNYDGY